MFTTNTDRTITYAAVVFNALVWKRTTTCNIMSIIDLDTDISYYGTYSIVSEHHGITITCEQDFIYRVIDGVSAFQTVFAARWDVTGIEITSIQNSAYVPVDANVIGGNLIDEFSQISDPDGRIQEAIKLHRGTVPTVGDGDDNIKEYTLRLSGPDCNYEESFTGELRGIVSNDHIANLARTTEYSIYEDAITGEYVAYISSFSRDINGPEFFNGSMLRTSRRKAVVGFLGLSDLAKSLYASLGDFEDYAGYTNQPY